ncbi:MAG: transcription-repair coupling factor, partial [Thermodesulfobacteriota bacterium]
FLGKDSVRHHPGSDLRPFSRDTQNPELTSRRLEILFRLSEGAPTVTVTSSRNLIERVMPKAALIGGVFTIKFAEEYPRDELLLKLAEAGYERRVTVEERGEMSVRGGIIDIFPPIEARPVRIEFFGDEVESIRPFDPSTQRSVGEREEVLILPVTEIPGGEEVCHASRERLIERAGDLDAKRADWEGVSSELLDGRAGHAAAFLWPLFYNEAATVFDYLPTETLVTLVEPAKVSEEVRAFSYEITEATERLTREEKFFLPKDALYLDPGELTENIERFPVLSLSTFLGGSESEIEFTSSTNIEIRHEIKQKKGDELLTPLAERISKWRDKGVSVFLTAHNTGQAARTAELMEGYGFSPSVRAGAELLLKDTFDGSPVFEIATGSLTTGFNIEEAGLAVISEEEVFGERQKRRPPPKRKLENFLSELQDLKVGDGIVHAQHGIAIYGGIKRIEVERIENDFLILSYHGGDKLYLPVQRMDLVVKYHGIEGRTFQLDRLGGTGWQKRKGKARKAVQKIAAELLKLYAERELSRGFAFSPPCHLYEEFSASFEYEETPDQATSIEEVIKDMSSERPMDRLVCGDVGYGKTEVAMRAAFKAVLDSKQVAILVPTTVLAEQHGQTFKERFAPYPSEVAVLSRFKSPKEQKKVIERVAAGEIDILIGTHRLLGRDVAFKDLGLIVVDEEHRFGVKHKEKLRAIKKEVDVLTLTATPIPRTLHMSIGGLRDLSIISTPPEDRLSVKTVTAGFDDEIIRDAIDRELKRSGQVFFVHNRVKSIGAMAEYLARLVPDARIAVAHGQMGEHELEKMMLGFISRDFDILLSTAIIESGLDIPSANTIIINRADRFGLAELYQLRGRVGRSRHRAYAYLLCPGGAVTADAEKRLEVVMALTEPGSGFRIASYDLELRGAGELLGSAQS